MIIFSGQRLSTLDVPMYRPRLEPRKYVPFKCAITQVSSSCCCLYHVLCATRLLEVLISSLLQPNSTLYNSEAGNCAFGRYDGNWTEAVVKGPPCSTLCPKEFPNC